MITIIHGDDIVSSRNYFVGLKTENKQNVSFDSKNISYTALLQVLKGGQLFSETKNIFIEDLLGNKKNITDSDKILELIKTDGTKFNFYFWDVQELSKTSLSFFPGANIKLFKIPQNIFSFLDNIRPNRSENIKNFHKVLETTEAEAIFYMLIRQFRLLIGLNSSIDEIKRLAPWQKEKFSRQAKFFDADELKKTYKKLFEIDLGIKSGTITNLPHAIDIFLLDL